MGFGASGTSLCDSGLGLWDLAPSNKVEGKKVKENLLDNNSNKLIFTGNLITDLL